MAFSPPSLPLPPDSVYLPAQNVVSKLLKIATVGNTAIWSYVVNSLEQFVSTLATYSSGQASVVASRNSSWLAFYHNTLTDADRQNPDGVQVNLAKVWWTSNVLPAFPLPAS